MHLASTSVASLTSVVLGKFTLVGIRPVAIALLLPYFLTYFDEF